MQCYRGCLRLLSIFICTRLATRLTTCPTMKMIQSLSQSRCMREAVQWLHAGAWHGEQHLQHASGRTAPGQQWCCHRDPGAQLAGQGSSSQALPVQLLCSVSCHSKVGARFRGPAAGVVGMLRHEPWLLGHGQRAVRPPWRCRRCRAGHRVVSEPHSGPSPVVSIAHFLRSTRVMGKIPGAD